MGLPPAPTMREFDIILPIFIGISLVMSAIRLWDRSRGSRFGWDDAFCIMSVINMTVFVIVFYLMEQPPPNYDPSTWYNVYYAAAVSFVGVVWMARVSLVFTAVRIAAFRNQKWLLTGIAAGFVVMYLILVAQTFWICEREPGWKYVFPAECDAGLERTITELCADVTSDLILLTVPIYLLSRTSLEWSVRIRLILLFSTCVLITFVSVLQDVLVFVGSGAREMFAAMMEASWALIVCSIPVVGSMILRRMTRLPDPEETTWTDPSTARHRPDTAGSTFGTTTVKSIISPFLSSHSRSRKTDPAEGHIDGVLVQHELNFESEVSSVRLARLDRQKTNEEWSTQRSPSASVSDVSKAAGSLV